MFDFRNKVGCGDIDEVTRGKREKVNDRSLHCRRSKVTDYAAQNCRQCRDEIEEQGSFCPEAAVDQYSKVTELCGISCKDTARVVATPRGKLVTKLAA
ncbi:MAG: hypothetical protein PHQ43_07075, partial [Dehalococcoidales bacterium]|nr:hypothetical protein [Dehalococcoidales bacterium]